MIKDFCPKDCKHKVTFDGDLPKVCLHQPACRMWREKIPKMSFSLGAEKMHLYINPKDAKALNIKTDNRIERGLIYFTEHELKAE